MSHWGWTFTDGVLRDENGKPVTQCPEEGCEAELQATVRRDVDYSLVNGKWEEVTAGENMDYRFYCADDHQFDASAAMLKSIIAEAGDPDVEKVI